MKLLLLWGLMMSTAFAQIDWQSHRGGRGLYPENTIHGMIKSLSFKEVTTLELDVVVSKDGEIVVSHEPWLNTDICYDRGGVELQTEKRVNLYVLDYADIKKYDCGSKPYPRFPKQEKLVTHKPRLIDLIHDVEDYITANSLPKIQYNIEIKSTPLEERMSFQPPYQEFTDKVLAALEATIKSDRVLIQSFDWRVLQYMRFKYPKFKTAALNDMDLKPEAIMNLLAYTPEVYSPHYKLLTAEQVKFFHKEGVRVIPWTVNEVKDMKAMIKMGVDGIITDYPNLIKEALK